MNKNTSHTDEKHSNNFALQKDFNDIRWQGRIAEKTLENTREIMSKTPAGNSDLKIRIEKVDGHDAECSMSFTPNMENSSGMLMGGYTFLFADFAGGAADVMPGLFDNMHITVDGHIQYLAPGEGKTIIARAHCEHFGRRLAYYSVQIYTDAGRHIAKVSLTYLHLV